MATQARPPAGVAGDATAYGLLGARLRADLGGLELALDGRGGQALDAAANGRWIEGRATARAGHRFGRAAVRVEVEGFGLSYEEPFAYRAGGVEATPSLAFGTPTVTWVLTPRVTAGGWEADSVSGDLWVAGGSVEAQRSFGPFDAVGRLEVLDVANGVTAGTFAEVGAGLVFSHAGWVVAGEVRTQRNPLETEVGGGLSVTATVSPAVRVRLEAARLLRDPVFGATGLFGLSAGVSIRPFATRAAARQPVADVGAAREGGRIARFSIRAPDAERVELTGDFTDWEPVPMTREGDLWTKTLVLPAGLHHFGFRVDGQWAVPPQSPGVVDDGWGRQNASIVVEP